jgi:hypothetical protein
MTATMTRSEADVTAPSPIEVRKTRRARKAQPKPQRPKLVFGVDVTPVVDLPLTDDQTNAFGRLLVQTKGEQEWTNPVHNELVCDYVRRLAKGERWVPTALHVSSRQLIAELFAQFCADNGISYTLLYPSSE